MTKKFEFGKIDFNGTGRKVNKVVVEVELRNRGGKETFTIDYNSGERVYTGNITPKYVEFSASAMVYNSKGTDIICGGQCLDEIATKLNNATFTKIFEFWKKYHLNGMKAGTPEQEKAVHEFFADNGYDYTSAVNHLKELGIYEMPFTGKSTSKVYENEMYRYGSAWLVEEIPENELEEIKKLFD